ncbi:MAG: hypothetical protein BGP01_11890 [Paludibacter sp. 47-17]|jgi:gliding motility-associated lipoprotein GldH|nr:MAG: hypothetical protein ABS72_02450 [Paludibacter sp. SCN 50-10]OJX91126.1 MAG: hypothetical protein BGP01_11890 [Paludibacter sp. 47-17]
MISSLRIKPVNKRCGGSSRRAGCAACISLLLVLAASSCSSNEVYNEYRALSREGWHRDSVVPFRAVVGDTLLPFDLYVQIRHTGRLALGNLWTVIDTYGPDSTWLQADTVELKLADEWGNWLGAGSGPAIDLQALYRSGLVFGRPGTYRFTLRHAMRDSVVPGLTHIGFRIAYRNGKE